MFVDVCFPDNNESQYIKMAKLLGTTGLCFVYKDRPALLKNDDAVRLFFASVNQGKLVFTSNLDENQKKRVFFYEPKIPIKTSFHYAVKGITQVTMNGIKERGGIFGISGNYLINTKKIEELCFVSKLAKKSQIPVFIASFARYPDMLRDSSTYFSMMKLITKDTAVAKNSMHSLYDFISHCI